MADLIMIRKEKEIECRFYWEKFITLNLYKWNKLELENEICRIEKEGEKITKIVIFGQQSISSQIKKIKNKYPIVILGHSSLSEETPVGSSIAINTIRLKNNESQVQLRYLRQKDRCIGVRLSCPDYDWFSTIGLVGKTKKRADKFFYETRDAYRGIDQLLHQQGMDLKNIYRFWNFLSDIGSNYKDFNRARDEYFTENNITKYPSATGIEAKLMKGYKICFGFEAVKPRGKQKMIFQTLSSKKQCEAWCYGPKFSRAAVVDYPGKKTEKLYITGTSSVDRQGRSILVTNKKENVRYVISCVEHLLRQKKMKLNDIVQAHVYCRDIGVYKQFIRLYKNSGWTFPGNLIFTMICRKDFIFEIEAIAARKI